jgi:hypothetical protein
VYLVDSKPNGTHNCDATRQGSNGNDLQSFSRRDCSYMKKMMSKPATLDVVKEKKALVSTSKVASKKKKTPPFEELSGEIKHSSGIGTLFSLEPRIMFDGAALVTGAEVVQTATIQDQTALPGIDGALWSSGLSLSTPSERKEIVFIDTRVDDYQALMEGIDPNADVILLDSTRDGIEQIAEVLNGRTDIDAIHLIAEGNEAELHLGNTFLTQESISGRYANLFTQIGHSLSADADLLIYGCNFGQGEAGQDAIKTLAELTGADIAASTDRTGHTTENADWELEVATGTIETSLVIGEATQAAWEGVLATFTVTTTTDGGAGSLRQAIIDANANAGTDTITFVGSGTYLLTIAGAGEDAAATGDLDITDDLILIGNGAGSTVIDGGGIDRVLHLIGTSTATISGITIQGGDQNNGGGIFVDNSSILNLFDATLTGNNHSGVGSGGAIHVHGTANLDRVLLSGNTADNGGAIGFHGANGGSLTNVTISGNTTTGNGGGIWNDSVISVTNSTITANSANAAGGIYNFGGTVNISNTIVSGNTAIGGDKDVQGTFSSDGFNLIEIVGTATGFGSDITGVSANLDVLADNGGSTQTHALLAGSLALNAGADQSAPTNDARSIARNEIPDIGAYESTAAASKVYWAEDGSNAIFRSNTDGSAKQQLLSGLGSPTGLDVDVIGGKIYWIESASTSLHRANLDGSNVENLDMTNLVNPQGIGLDLVNGHIYVADDGNGADDAIRRFNLDGTGFATIVNNLNGVIRDVAADPTGGKLYFTEFGVGFFDGEIKSTNIGGGPIQDVVTGQTGPASLVLDVAGSRIYWTDNGSFGFDSIKRADLDGLNLQTVNSTGLQDPSGIAIDLAESKIYWGDQSSNFVRRSDLNGTNEEDVVTGLNSPREIAVIRLGGTANTAPTVDLDANNSSGAAGNDYSFTFTEGDGPTAIADSDADLVDVDSITFANVQLSINGLLDGNTEVLVLDGDTFALATGVAGQDTSGGNYRVALVTGAGTATVTITKQGGGTFNETETETLLSAIQYQHTDTSAPTDGDRLIDVTVNDGITDSAVARTTINVNPVNDAPSITSDGGGAAAAVNAAENQTSVTTVTATDADVPADTLQYTIIGGADAALFSLDLNTGVLAFNTAPDFEAPGDVGANNVYDLVVQVSDGQGGLDTQAIAVTVTAVNEAPSITSDGGGATAAVNAVENQTAVTTVTATDQDVPADTLQYTIIGGADQALFSLDLNTGVLAFNTAPDFEVLADANADGVYEVTVQVDDGNGGTDTQSLAITATDLQDGLPQLPPPPPPPPPEPLPEPRPDPEPLSDPEPPGPSLNGYGDEGGFVVKGPDDDEYLASNHGWGVLGDDR